ncbi:hypothetical protein C8R43DRAFT_1119699 [Mycena crocata]|nr:hypothetical protein C8R43DRAFT_1119699 [Mycena crocata]
MDGVCVQDFCRQRQRTAATSKQCIPPNLGVLKIRDRRAAAAITTPPRMEVLQCARARRVELKANPCSDRRVAAAETITRHIEIPRVGGKSRFFCRRRPTPRYDLEVPYFPNRQHLPPTREPPRRGGGSSYATYRNPASGLKFEFLPPEANTPLRLQSTVFPQTPESPTYLRAAA